jgi:hypothetical protein
LTGGRKANGQQTFGRAATFCGVGELAETDDGNDWGVSEGAVPTGQQWALCVSCKRWRPNLDGWRDGWTCAQAKLSCGTPFFEEGVARSAEARPASAWK